MWIGAAVLSAFFAEITAVLAKCGIRKTDSDVATALRTVVVLIFSWVMVFLVGSQKTIGEISGKSLLFLVLSGLSTGASWLCYYKALQMGEASKVVPIDKLSIVFTIVLAYFFLHEQVDAKSVFGCLLIVAGTLLMVL